MGHVVARIITTIGIILSLKALQISDTQRYYQNNTGLSHNTASLSPYGSQDFTIEKHDAPMSFAWYNIMYTGNNNSNGINL